MIINLYQEFSVPIDVRAVRTMHDLEISQALASTLVSLNSRGEPSANLGSSWLIKDRQITFELRAEAKWSDGAKITADHVCESFADTRRLFGDALRSFFDNIEKIEPDQPNLFTIYLRPSVSPDFILRKLTEPMYGIVRLGRPNVSSGPYIMESHDENNLVLAVNPNWFDYNSKSCSIHLRRPTQAQSTAKFSTDPWPTLMSTAGLHSKHEVKALGPEFSKWTRQLDRLLLISAAQHNLDLMRRFFAYVRSTVSFADVVNHIYGAKLANQMFPSHAFIPPPRVAPQVWPKIVLAYDPKRVPKDVVNGIRASLPDACEFRKADHGKIRDFKRKGSIDLHLTSVGVDPLNLEGALTHYIELDPPLIPSDSSIHGNFIRRLHDARRNQDSDKVYHQIISDAVTNNYVLPILHYSTLWIGRNGVDFSQASAHEETIPYHKLRA